MEKDNMDLNKLICSVFVEKQDEEYLGKLAKQFAILPNKNYILARSIVMDIHLSLEYMMNFGIAHVCCVGTQNIKNLGHKIDPIVVFKTFAELDFFKKINIVEALHVFESDCIVILKKINDLRKAFAHGYGINDFRYNYKSVSIFNRDAIDVLIKDHKKVMENFMKDSFEKVEEAEGKGHASELSAPK